jgi:hypothetical protein
MAKQRKTPPGDGKENKKIRFVPGTYDPQETAGYMLDVPEVNVPMQGAPWVKYMREYEKNNPKDAFIEQKKKSYLRLHPGLNKAAGVTMDRFPSDVLQNFVKEYDYKKNSYVTKKYGKETGFNPNKRGEWVDDLNPTFKDKFVSNSRYENKLEPSYLSRGLAGAQELGNFLIKALPGTQGDVLKYDVPGLTKKEQKEIANSSTGALETFAPIDIPGVALANYLKNVGLTTGSDFKELPAAYSGEKMANVTDVDALAMNPLNWTLPGDIAALASLAPAAAKLAKGAPAALDNILASGIGRVNEELVSRAGKYFDPGAVTDLPVEATPERLKFLQDLEELKRTVAFRNSPESKQAALTQLAHKTKIPDELFEQVTGFNKKELLGIPEEPPTYFGNPPTQEEQIALQEARAAEREAMRAQGVEPDKAPPEGYVFDQASRQLIPAPTGYVAPDAFEAVRQAQQRAARGTGDAPTQNIAGDLDIDNQLPPPPDEIIIPDTDYRNIDINNLRSDLDSYLANARSSSDAAINMMNASQDTRTVRSLEDRIAEIRGALPPDPDNPAAYHRRDLSNDPDFALTNEEMDAYGYDPYEFVNTSSDDSFASLFDPLSTGSPKTSRSALQRFTDAMRNGSSKVKETLLDTNTASEAKRLPELYKAMYKEASAAYPDHYATPTLYARNFDSPREMHTYLTKTMDKIFNDAKVGEIVTGSTNTSYNSYVPQMGYIFKNAGKDGLSDPIFLGYESMNDSGFLNSIDHITDINKQDILSHLNKQLNTLQKRSGKNLRFEKNPVYMDKSGNIMVPQYGLRKTKDTKINISKKGKYGGDVSKLKKFTK